MAFDSLFIGVSGLESYQSQIDVISNNIANVGTTGYKGQNVTFQDLLYQTQQYESGPSATRGGVNAEQVGLGVKVATIDTNLQQGGLQTTGVNTDLSINGSGYFVLSNTSSGGAQVFTRDGHFQLNPNGVLYDPSSGLAVQGYQANSAGVVTVTNTPTSIQIPLGLKSQATATGAGSKLGPTGDKQFDFQVGGNLDQTQYLQAVASNGGVSSGNLATISTTMYDSLGGAHLVNITFQPLASAAGGIDVTTTKVANTAGTLVSAASEWSINVQSTDGTIFAASNGGTGTSIQLGNVFFDQNGQFINTSGTQNAAGAANTHASNTSPSYVAGDQLVVTQWGTPKGAQNATVGAAGSPPASGPIGFDFSSMTGLIGATTANPIAQNGYAAGILSNITVGQDGKVTGAFTNGQSQVLAQVAVATFQNEQGLKRNGSNQFQASANSGIAQFGAAGSGRFGTIVSGSLEQSNVSIADEFTKMILAQRSFEANSRSITTADQDLQTVIGLKR